MAVDGSFRLEAELKRFLDRRPKLKSIARFNNLLNKGDLVTENEVVYAVEQLLLYPKYTIPLLGCLRPIAEKIVEKTVTLLHSVPNLRIDDDDCIEEFDEDEFLRDSENVDSAEVANVIDVYVRRGKGLRLHELACLAFYRALDLIPFLLGSILKYFKAAPAPFERFLQCETFSKASATGANQLLDVVRATYGLLMMETDVFRTFWDWSCFLDLVQKSPNLILLNNTDLRKIIGDVTLNDPELKEIVSDIRWCSIEILSLVLGLSFKASAKLGRDSEESIQSVLRWREFCTEVLLEKGSWYLESPVQETLAMVGRKTNFKERNPGNRFFLTSNMTKSFEMVSLAVSQRWPVLLYGPSGSGKSALINNLAHSLGSRGNEVPRGPKKFERRWGNYFEQKYVEDVFSG